MARNLEDDLNEKIDRAILEEAQKPRRERMSNVALGRMFDVHETTIRRHKQALQKALRLPVEQDRDEFFDIPVNAITQRRRTIRLEDGSYERVTYNPAVAVAEDVREASYKELEKVFDRLKRIGPRLWSCACRTSRWARRIASVGLRRP